MAAGHGGARAGAGRPKKQHDAGKQEPAARFDDALAYLEAVVRGDVKADSLRVAAARIVLPYQQPKRRAPVESPPPKKLRQKQDGAAVRAEAAAWQSKAADVRRKLAAKKGKTHD